MSAHPISRGLAIATALILLLQASTTSATTFVRSSLGKGRSTEAAPSSYCEIRGVFEKPAHETHRVKRGKRMLDERRVSWVIQVESATAVGQGACPTSSRFELAVRGADHIEHPTAGGRYVYPDAVEQPRAMARVRLKARFGQVVNASTGENYSEWSVTGWENGFESEK